MLAVLVARAVIGRLRAAQHELFGDVVTRDLGRLLHDRHVHGVAVLRMQERVGERLTIHELSRYIVGVVDLVFVGVVGDGSVDRGGIVRLGIRIDRALQRVRRKGERHIEDLAVVGDAFDLGHDRVIPGVFADKVERFVKHIL